MKVKRKRELKRKWEKKTSGKVGRWGGSFPTWNKSKREKKKEGKKEKGRGGKENRGRAMCEKGGRKGEKRKGRFSRYFDG